MPKNDILQKAEEYMKLKSGETIEEAVNNGEDARREWIIATLESGMEIPKH